MTHCSFQISITPAPKRAERVIPSMLTLMSGIRLAGNNISSVPSEHASAAVMLRPLVRSKWFSQTGQTARLRGGSRASSSSSPQSAQAIVIVDIVTAAMGIRRRDAST